jgi:hypothetical protein
VAKFAVGYLNKRQSAKVETRVTTHGVHTKKAVSILPTAKRLTVRLPSLKVKGKYHETKWYRFDASTKSILLYTSLKTLEKLKKLL